MVDANGGALEAKERRTRQLAMRVAASVSVGGTALLLYTVFPLFPIPVLALVAILLGILSYKAPRLALVIALLMVVPGMVYQLGLPNPQNTGLPLVVVIVITLAFAGIAVGAEESAARIGIAAGASAGALMLTPLHFMALPIMVGTPLLRGRGTKVGSAASILAFGVVYFPALMLGQQVQSSSDDVLLYGAISNANKEVLLPVDITLVGRSLAEAIPVLGSAEESAYLLSAANYWPTFGGGRVIPLGVLLGLLLALGIAGAFFGVTGERWLARREVAAKWLPWAGPTASVMIGIIILMVPLYVLGESLQYHIDVSWPGLVAGTLAVGLVGSAVEDRLRRRDYLVRLRSQLAESIPSVEQGSEALANRINGILVVVPALDLVSEKGLAEEAEQEIGFMRSGVEELSAKDLASRVEKFRDLDERLTEALTTCHTSLCARYDDLRQQYNTYVKIGDELGIGIGDPVGGSRLEELEFLRHDEILSNCQSLNEMYKLAARKMLTSAKDLEEVFSREVDAEFKRVQLVVAQQYLDREQAIDALDAVANELVAMDKVIGDQTNGLETQVGEAARAATTTLSKVLVPTLEAIGDWDLGKQHAEYAAGTERLSTQPVTGGKLPGLRQTIHRSAELARITREVTSCLEEKVSAIRKEMASLPSHEYGRGSTEQVVGELAASVATLKESGDESTIGSRVRHVQRQFETVENVAALIRQYSGTREFVLNFANVEYLMDEILRKSGVVHFTDIPVQANFAHQYLRVYAEKHRREVAADPDAGIIRQVGGP